MSRRYYKLLRERMKEVREKYDEEEILGRAFDFSRDCFGYQSPGFEIQRAVRFWQVVGTLFFGAGLIEGLSKRKSERAFFRLLFC